METKKFDAEAKKQLLMTLKGRFEKNMERHKGLNWEDVETVLEKNPAKMKVLFRMEETGGEPDVVRIGKSDSSVSYIDCSPESPSGRRNTCWDREAQMARKADSRPEFNAVDMAKEIGCEILDENQYRELQKYGEFDLKTSSWIQTPEAIRKLGGALFCDRRYDHVFTYHNGVQSYYSSRGFRGIITL